MGCGRVLRDGLSVRSFFSIALKGMRSMLPHLKTKAINWVIAPKIQAIEFFSFKDPLTHYAIQIDNINPS